MNIIEYPHPTLRHKSRSVQRIDAALREVVREMFDLMYLAKGVGLAANQVDLPLRLFVVNLAGKPGEGEEMVFVNPVLSQAKGQSEREEGCLSLPGLYANVKRPEKIRLQAYNLRGEEFNQEVSGMMACVVQHETDHLDGVLFIDRLTTTGKMTIADALDEFEVDFQSKRETGGIPSDAEIRQRLADWEKKYC